MSVQLSLEGFLPEQPVERLYLALFPPPEVAQAMVALGREAGLRGSPVEAERLHLSLHGSGDHAGLPPGMEAAARGVLEAQPLTGFELCLDWLQTFGLPGHKRMLVLCEQSPSAPLRELHRQLGERLCAAGLASWTQAAFSPHVTLQYPQGAVAPCRVTPLRWSRHTLQLVRSQPLRGTRQVLASRALGGECT